MGKAKDHLPKRKQSAPPSKPKGTPGPKPDTLKIDGDWHDAIKKSLTKKKPITGWPQ